MSEQSNPEEVDLSAFADAVASGAAVVDVRNPDEYDEGHVPGAILIPLAELPDRLTDVPSADPVFVVCAAGGRSLQATRALRSAGYPAVSVAGGTNAWRDSGRALAEGRAAGTP